MYSHSCHFWPYTATVSISDQLCMLSKRDTQNLVIWLVDFYKLKIYLPYQFLRLEDFTVVLKTVLCIVLPNLKKINL